MKTGEQEVDVDTSGKTTPRDGRAAVCRRVSLSSYKSNCQCVGDPISGVRKERKEDGGLCGDLGHPAVLYVKVDIQY